MRACVSVPSVPSRLHFLNTVSLGLSMAYIPLISVNQTSNVIKFITKLNRVFIKWLDWFYGSKLYTRLIITSLNTRYLRVYLIYTHIWFTLIPNPLVKYCWLFTTHKGRHESIHNRLQYTTVSSCTRTFLTDWCMTTIRVQLIPRGQTPS